LIQVIQIQCGQDTTYSITTWSRYRLFKYIVVKIQVIQIQCGQDIGFIQIQSGQDTGYLNYDKMT